MNLISLCSSIAEAEWTSRRASANAHNADGQALVELALLVPLFALMLLGAAEFSRVEYASVEVANAARAGVQYGAQNRITALDLTGMQRAAVSDGPEVTSLLATASSFCTCSDGTSITCANASTNCAARISQYVQVNTTAAVTPLMYCPGLPRTYTVQSVAAMRVEQ